MILNTFILCIMLSTEPILTLNFSQDENIDNAFLRLSAAITEMIQDVDFFCLQKACIEKAFSPLMPSKATEIIPIVTSASSFHDLCLKLAKTVYWNFLDIRMIEAMASASLIAPAYESIENFKETFFNMTLAEAAPYLTVTRNESEMCDDDYSQITIHELYRHQFYLKTQFVRVGSDMLKTCRIVIEYLSITTKESIF